MQISHIVLAVVLIFAMVWIFLAIALSQLPENAASAEPGQSGFKLNPFLNSITTRHTQEAPPGEIQEVSGVVRKVARPKNVYRDQIAKPITPSRIIPSLPILAPPSLAEVERNMTLYLQTLHTRLSALAGPKVTALKTWDAFMEVTAQMPMKWDIENKDRCVLTHHRSMLPLVFFMHIYHIRESFLLEYGIHLSI